jgi:hypothetical protein
LNVRYYDFGEGISPLGCSHLLPHSARLHCEQTARFFNFVFLSYDLDLQAIHQKLPLSSMPFYLIANQLEDAWCLSAVL